MSGEASPAQLSAPRRARRHLRNRRGSGGDVQHLHRGGAARRRRGSAHRQARQPVVHLAVRERGRPRSAGRPGGGARGGDGARAPRGGNRVHVRAADAPRDASRGAGAPRARDPDGDEHRRPAREPGGGGTSGGRGGRRAARSAHRRCAPRPRHSTRAGRPRRARHGRDLADRPDPGDRDPRRLGVRVDDRSRTVRVRGREGRGARGRSSGGERGGGARGAGGARAADGAGGRAPQRRGSDPRLGGGARSGAPSSQRAAGTPSTNSAA